MHAEGAYADEALPPGHEIFQAYENGDIQEAQKLLSHHIQESCKYALKPVTGNTSNIGIEERLGIGSCANVAAHALSLHKKYASQIPVQETVIDDIRYLLRSIDKVLNNVVERARSNERLLKLAEYVVIERKKLLDLMPEIMKDQGMAEQAEGLLKNNT